MKKKKHREMDLLVIFLCIVAFVGVLYIFFFAKTTHRTAPNDPPPPVAEEQTPPAPTIEKDALPQVKEETTPLPTASSLQPQPPAELRMYNKEPFTAESEVDDFFPSEKIFVTVTFPELPAGTYNLTANWLDPSLRKNSSTNHTFKLDKTSGHRVKFWFELIKNGAFTEMFTGNEFKKSAYGTWQVEILMNSQPLQSKKFTIHE